MNEKLVSLKSPDAGFTSALLGGKGFGLWKMAQEGYPVPPAYIITTEVCREYMKDPAKVEQWLKDEALFAIRKGFFEEFGYMPLVSVRSGAAQSMPGMLDTILNVGLTRVNVGNWATKLGTECAEDSFCRLIEMYANVVHGVERKEFQGCATVGSLNRYQIEVGKPFPNADEQLYESIIAVFKSWNNERAVTYRDLNGIAHDGGTAVTIQAMVFGNFNDKSATGVLFTRDPATGADELVGDFAINAQGEDVVAGYVTPKPISDMQAWNHELLDELMEIAVKLEKSNKDMQDIEFTVQDGKLYILQTRNAKRTAQAAVAVAVGLYEDELITREVAISRVTAKQIAVASRPAIDPAWVEKNPPHAVGLPASNGVAVGKAVFSSEKAEVSDGLVILITQDTDPDDIAGMAKAVGFLTQRGGSTCHAAVVGRAMDKVAVVGCEALKLGPDYAYIHKADGYSKYSINEGDLVAIDGASGNVWFGCTPDMIGGAVGPVRAFLKLLSEVYGYYEVATKADDIVNPERVLVPAYLMTPEDMACEVAMMVGKVKDLIIDMREVVLDPISIPLTALWGTTLAVSNHMETVLLAMKYKNVRVISPLAQAMQFQAAGYEPIHIIKTWDELEAAEGLVVADHHALSKIAAKIPTILKQKAEKGVSVHSLNCVSVIDKNKPYRGAKFAITPMNAALSLLT